MRTIQIGLLVVLACLILGSWAFGEAPSMQTILIYAINVALFVQSEPRRSRRA